MPDNNSVDIILAKTATCPFCINFNPIWEAAANENNLTKQLGGRKVNFNAFDMKKLEDKNKFESKYTGLSEILEGYPTVYIQFFHDDKLKTAQVEHTSINVRTGGGSNNNKTQEAVDRFLNNIVNVYKTLTSDNKAVHVNVQDGGKLPNSIYKEKYLKYKAKYIELKKSNF